MEFLLLCFLNANTANVDLAPNLNPLIISKTEGENPEHPNPGEGRR